MSAKLIDDRERLRKVVLLPHNPNWRQQFAREASILEKILGNNCQAIHHIGSTAIPDMPAKPIIDILIVVYDLTKVDQLNALFEQQAYQCMGEYGMAGRRFYWKGTPDCHTYHIHLFARGNSEIDRHLAFKSYLIQHNDIASGYATIKRCLARQFADDIENYVDGKESFIRMIDYKTGHAKPDQLAAKDDIVLEDYNPAWQKLAQAEIQAIQESIALPYKAIEHLGSTAVNGLKAKPIIDIFITLDSMTTAKQWIKPLEALGYCYWYDNPDNAHHRFFKGMPPFGLKRTHHAHIMAFGEDFKQRVAFRDKLRKDSILRQKYEQLKCQLAEDYPYDREAYTAAKEDFVKCVLKMT
ncbi:MAG: GrpB family protein [Pseudomonadota bacterium]